MSRFSPIFPVYNVMNFDAGIYSSFLMSQTAHAKWSEFMPWFTRISYVDSRDPADVTSTKL